MRIERDETAKAFFDEIIDDFDAIKTRRVLFNEHFCVLLPEKAGYSYVSIEL